MNDHGICGGDIQAGFDNRRRQKNVIFAVVKRIHPVIQLSGRHLAIRHHIAQFWQLFFQKVFNFGQIGDAGDDIKRLPPPVMLAQQRLPDADSIKFAHIGAD